MHEPGLLEIVHILGMDEVYVVTRVDHEAQKADLLPLVYTTRAIPSVPFLAIEPIPGGGLPKLRPD